MTHIPFKDLSDAEKGALLLAEHRGKRIDHFVYRHSTMREWTEKRELGFYPSVIYRIAPEPLTPDSINWDHVAGLWRYMARDFRHDALLYSEEPTMSSVGWTPVDEGQYTFADAHTSYRRGTVGWKDSLVVRPGYEESK